MLNSRQNKYLKREKPNFTPQGTEERRQRAKIKQNKENNKIETEINKIETSNMNGQ